MYSLVSSAKADGVEPFAWLREPFTRLPYHPPSRKPPWASRSRATS
jgi:hypothetical protein